DRQPLHRPATGGLLVQHAADRGWGSAARAQPDGVPRNRHAPGVARRRPRRLTMTIPHTAIRRLTFVLALLLVLPAWGVASSAQEGRLPETSSVPAVDLASVALPPEELPERGYQLAQAGDIELD